MAYFYYQTHKIYYYEIGTGLPLVLLHGNTASSAMFSAIAPELAQDYKIILIDFLGCGKSDHIATLAEDLWYDEAMQVICFLEEKHYHNVKLIGTSGGALAALNVSLERPDLVSQLIADSFEGEEANASVTEMLRQQRQASKSNASARLFYEQMHGTDWEQAIDADTQAVVAHAAYIKKFFHKPISQLKPEILLTGSCEDAFFPAEFYKILFHTMLKKIGHGEQHLFQHGKHPAMLSNQKEFIKISKRFFK